MTFQKLIGNETIVYEVSSAYRICHMPTNLKWFSIEHQHFLSYSFFRQLEAIIRISESLAKMRLAPFATEADVDEALRLFQVSTLDAATSGNLAGEGSCSEKRTALALWELYAWQCFMLKLNLGMQISVI